MVFFSFCIFLTVHGIHNEKMFNRQIKQQISCDMTLHISQIHSIANYVDDKPCFDT